MSQGEPGVFITDLPSRVVGGFKPAAGKGVGWISFDYRCEGFGGLGLSTGALSGAPTLTLDLGLTGEHVLYFGLGKYGALRAWLDGDKGYREFVPLHGSHTFQEARFHRADLTGKRLHIQPRRGPEARGLTLAYIRAVPGSEDHAPRQSARNLVATNDGWSYLAVWGYEGPADIYRMFTPLRDSDVFRLIYNPCGADVTTYHPTRVGTIMPSEPTHAYRVCDYVGAEATKRLTRDKVDPLAIARDATRDLGIELHFYIRPEAFYCPHPWEGAYDSRFFHEHPEWRCRDEFGDEIRRMSYAFPGVQGHMLAYFEELLAYQPEGLCLAMNRSLPMMICEAPVIEAFQREHGRAPRLPEECDSPEMLAVRHGILAGFLERVVRLLESRGMTLSVIVDGNPHSNRLFGCDLEDLARRGWLQAIYCTNACDGEAWQRVRGTGVPIFPTGKAWRADYDQAALARHMRDNILGQGFAGGFFWDIEQEFENPYNWHVVRHLGTPEFLDGMISGRIKTPILRPYTHIAGCKVDRYNPHRSY